MESLFNGYEKRKGLKDALMEAELGEEGVCDVCKDTAPLNEMENLSLCEACMGRAESLLEGVDMRIPEVSELKDVLESLLINEAVFYFDMTAMQKEANKNFNGDVVQLCKSYKLNPYKVYSDRIDFQSKSLNSPKRQINKLMMDFGGEFSSEKTMQSTGPDPDGTVAPPIIHGKGLATPAQAAHSTATASAVTAKAANQTAPASTAPAKKTVSARQSVSTVNMSNDPMGDTISLKFGEISVLLNKKSTLSDTSIYGLSIFLNRDFECDDILVNEKDLKNEKTFREFLLQQFINEPHKFFPAFEGSANGIYKVLKYEKAEFRFDNASFGKKLSLSMVTKSGKENRVPLDVRALENKSILNVALIEHIDKLVQERFPALFPPHNKIKTSIGDAVFTYYGVNGDEVAIEVDWAGCIFKALLASKLVEDANKAYSQFMTILYKQGIGQVIPGFTPSDDFQTLKFPTNYDVAFKMDTQAFAADAIIKFKVEVLDKAAGNIIGSDSLIIRRPDEEHLKKILSIAEKIYAKENKDSNGVAVMTSFIERLSNPTKRRALLFNIGRQIEIHLKKEGVQLPNDCLIEVELSQKNYIPKIDSVILILTVPSSSATQDAFDTYIKEAAKKTKWFSPASCEVRQGELQVTLPITDLKSFTKDIGMDLMEEVIQPVRKTFIV